jgi:biotin carboxylase
LPSLEERVLVVGTTGDYIDHIHKTQPGRTVFLIDPDPAYPIPSSGPDRQLRCRLTDPDHVVSRLRDFLTRNHIRLSGIACFDCESLLIAAHIAQLWSLPFPSPQPVFNCRDKSRSKILWRKGGTPCPEALLSHDVNEVLGFMEKTGSPVILKPPTLSGSELTFRCNDPDQAVAAFRKIREGLLFRRTDATLNRDGLIDERVVLCEEYISGPEFSCDFILEGEVLEVVRVAAKYPLKDAPVGTTQAYEIPAGLPIGISINDLRRHLAEAVRSLGLIRCMGMADFIVRDGQVQFLEITPRPGGDCLPQLIAQSCGLDMLALHLDFAEGLPLDIPAAPLWRHLVALRLYAPNDGRLRAIRLHRKWIEQEVLEEVWLKRPGDLIQLPPDDYQSWLLGHVIFRPDPDRPVEAQLREVYQAVDIDIQ